jgi:hypothetical protein
MAEKMASSLSSKALFMNALGLTLLALGIPILKSYPASSVGILLASLVLLGTGLLLLQKSKRGLGFRLFRIYNFFLIGLGIPALCFAGFTSGRFIVLANQGSPLVPLLAIAWCLTIAACTVIAYEVSSLLQAISPRVPLYF